MKLIRQYGLHILILFHLVGLVGILFINQEVFTRLTPANLLLSAFLLLAVQESNRRPAMVLFVFCLLSGYLVELLGTQSGYPFGHYYYGSALGPQFFEVPLIIGTNWFLMVMGSGYLARRISSQRIFQILLASLIMVLVDLAIEPLAPKLDYWYWLEGQPPLLNYLGWFVVALIMQVVFQKTVAEDQNYLAIPYIFIVSAFFVILNFTL